jgi:tetratricopeptide (TPR) repeat protein
MSERRITVKEALDEAVKYHADKKYSKADELYTKILLQYPDHPDALHNLGVLALEIGDKFHAIEKLKRVVDKYPKFEQFHFSLIDALIEFNEFEQAKLRLNVAENFGFNKDKLSHFSARLRNAKQQGK